jgi:photosystem II stability/assembly factor-like uncharacterized protein
LGTTSLTTSAPPPAGVAGERVGAAQLADVVFTDRGHGYAIVTGFTRLAATDDGGTTWRLEGRPVATLAPASAAGRSHVLFVSGSTGFVYGQGLALTRDGGSTWTYPDVAPGGYLMTSLVAIHQSVWATLTCPGGGCPATAEVVASSDGGTSWGPLSGEPTLAAPPASLARITSTSAFVVAEAGAPEGSGAQGSGAQGSGALLARTDDGGRSWATVQDPCDLPGPSALRLAAFASGLLLVCGGSPGAGSQPLAVYASSDGGAHWELRSTTGFVSHPSVGEVPGRCCLADLAAVSPSLAWMAISEDTLYGTTDGGRTWRPAFPATGAGDGATRVTFVDAQHGWTLAERGLWRTIEGVHWSRL